MNHADSIVDKINRLLELLDDLKTWTELYKRDVINLKNDAELWRTIGVEDIMLKYMHRYVSTTTDNLLKTLTLIMNSINETASETAKFLEKFKK